LEHKEAKIMNKAYDILRLAVLYRNFDLYDCTEMKTFIDRLPSVIESQSSSCHEVFLELFCVLVEKEDIVCVKNLENVVCRICSSVFRMASKKISLNFTLDILYSIMMSRYHTLMRSQHSQIISVCIKAIGYDDTCETASRLLASIYNYEKVDDWMQSWQRHIMELEHLLQLIGAVPSLQESNNTSNKVDSSLIRISSDDGDNSNEGIDTYNNKNSSKKRKLKSEISGFSKIKKLQRHFSAHINVLCEMIRHGCSSGYISIPLDGFFRIVDGISSLTGDINHSDPRLGIMNELGIIPSHLAIITCDLKKQAFKILYALLNSIPNCLAAFGTRFVKCLSSLFCSVDTLGSPDVIYDALTCISAASRCYPSLLSTSGEAILTLIMNLYNAEVYYATNQNVSVESKIRDELHSFTSILPAIKHALPGNATTAGFEKVTNTCEIIITYCGSYLSDEFREALQISIGRVLLCCCKGVMLRNASRTSGNSRQSKLRMKGKESKLNRVACEIIREDSGLREATIRLALAEILSIQRSGVMSSNITLLKRVCISSRKLPGCAVTVANAMNTIAMIMHPVVSPVPILDMKKFMREQIMDLEESRHASETMTVLTQDQNTRQFMNTWNSKLDEEADNKESKSKIILHKDKKDNSISFPPPLKESSVTVDVSSTEMGFQQHINIATDNDEDDELPDLDIDAEPDKE